MKGEQNGLIQWPRAKYWTGTFNTIIGCRKVSPACDNCYAEAWANRFGLSFDPHPSTQGAPPRKGVVFCGNVCDMFGECRSYDDMVADLLKTQCKTATYLWLTKRVGRMVEALRRLDKKCGDGREGFTWFPETWYSGNYFGFTAENQEWFERRCRHMCEFPVWANAPWLSLEPLLGPVELRGVNASWVVVGCESGRNRRPCEIKWIEDVLSACMPAGIPVFVKQIRLPDGRFTNKIEEFPEHLRVRQVPWEKKGNEDDDD